MASCEELAVSIANGQAQLIVDDAVIQAAQNVRSAHQTQLWFDQYNYFLQGCNSGGGGSGSGGFGSTGEATVEAKKGLPVFPSRNPSEMLLIMANPALYELHNSAVERARMIGVAV